jgi:mono/diheme cytochrome c family protein
MSNADRVHNFAAAQVDRQAVFHGNCANCHVKLGDGKFGKELYDADCAICHEDEHRATMAPNLHTISQTNGVEFWQTWIAHGKPHSLMPAFATSEGGPLTDAQIVSLADYIATIIPSKSAGN